MVDKNQNKIKAPKHLAIIMDGNGRWAKKRFLPRIAGHKQGVDSLQRCVGNCIKSQIQILTVFAFSSENWQRPQEEVSALMELTGKAIIRELPQLQKNQVKIHFIGEKTALSEKLQKTLKDAEENTKKNEKLILNICFNYGGRWDIAQAANALAQAGQEITPENINKKMALSHVPDPDLLIRTGGEMRISNFLLWQSAYSELYFCEDLWPDFNEKSLQTALSEYTKRERRFGKTSEQIKK